MSVGQARQTLENLIDDRKVLSRQLAELRSEEQDEDDEPAAKVLSVCPYLSVCLSISLSACLSVGFDTLCFHFFKHCLTDSFKKNCPLETTIASVFRTSCLFMNCFEVIFVASYTH